MSDLDQQVRTYIEGTSAPLSLDEVLADPATVGADPTRRYKEPISLRRGIAIGLAAAFVVIVIIGLPLLWNTGNSEPVATTAVPPTTEAIESATTVVATTAAPPTTSIEVAPTTVTEMTIEVTQSVVPGLGTLVWERLTGTSETLPEGVDAYEDGAYVAYDEGGLWTSEDGVSWTFEEMSGAADEYDWFHSEGGDYAIAGSRDTSVLLERVGGEWTELELATTDVPVVPGVDFLPNFQLPIESNGVELIPVSLWGSLGLGDVYGVFEIDCGQPEPCEMEPWPEWDELTERIRIRHPERDTVLASLAIEVDGETVSLVDDATGEAVRSYRGTALVPAEKLVEQFTLEGSVRLVGAFVASDGGPFVWHDPPWRDPWQVLVAPQGGFVAYDFRYDWRSDPPLQSARVWTSDDGIEWVEQGAPSFVDATADHMMVTISGDQLLATIITGYDESTGLELFDSWTSSDGVTWEASDSAFAPHSSAEEANFGYVVTSLPQGTWQIWVSLDGDNWHEVVGPPGPHEPGGAGYAGADAAGDHIFVSVGLDSGERTLWVGSFEP